MLTRTLIIVAIVFASAVSATSQRSQPHSLGHGSLVVWVVGENFDYFVVGAESKITYPGHGHDESGCKIISLGKRTLFFATGNLTVPEGGSLWSASGFARSVFRTSPSNKRDASSLSARWSQLSADWFARVPIAELARYTSGPDKGFVIGIFASFKSDKLGLERDFFHYVQGKPRLVTDHVSLVATSASGLTTGLAEESLGQLSERSMVWRMSGPRFPDAARQDAEYVRQAIEFAIKYSTATAHEEIGGKIDIAILRRGEDVTWVDRKPGCERQDEP